MGAYEIQSDIDAIEKNSALYEENNFDSRVAAINHIDFNVIDRLEGLLQTTNQPEELIQLKQYAERVKRQLENIDDNSYLFKSSLVCRETDMREWKCRREIVRAISLGLSS